jgi:hypothetical protein
MRKFVVALCLLLCTTPLIYAQKARYGQSPDKPNSADYPIKVHISATHRRYYCSGQFNDITCGEGLYADAMLDGKKIELGGTDVIFNKHVMLIIPGDYQAKLTKDTSNAEGTLFGQEYDLLLPDGTVWKCFTSGISE